VQLQSQLSRVDSLGVAVIAHNQEEKDLSMAPDMARKNGLEFPVVHDVNHELAPHFDRTNAYFLDSDGVVQQIFPMSSYMRPSMSLVFNEIKAILKAERVAQEPLDG
jgi:hypothetical protein